MMYQSSGYDDSNDGKGNDTGWYVFLGCLFWILVYFGLPILIALLNKL